MKEEQLLQQKRDRAVYYQLLLKADAAFIATQHIWAEETPRNRRAYLDYLTHTLPKADKALSDTVHIRTLLLLNGHHLQLVVPRRKPQLEEQQRKRKLVVLKAQDEIDHQKRLLQIQGSMLEPGPLHGGKVSE